MDVTTDFGMLFYTIDVCTDEGYQVVSEESEIIVGTYQPDWLRIRTKIIDYYQQRNPNWGD